MSKEPMHINRTHNSNIRTLILMAVIIAIAYITGIGCPIKFFTGISCPGCGITRAVVSCVKLEFAEAAYYHPLVFILIPGIVLSLFWKKISNKARKSICVTAVLLFLAIYVLRLFVIDNGVVTVNVKDGFIYRTISGIINGYIV